MNKAFAILSALMIIAGTARATDVTIGANTQPNFNPTNVPAAVTIPGVTVSSGANAVLSCSSCFRPNWVGMSGFYITVGSANYYVKSVDSVSQVTLASDCTAPSPATVIWNPYVELRIYADRAFQPLGESYIVQPGSPGSTAWYKRYGASILTVNGVRTLYIPEIIIDATTDAIGPTNQARYTAGFYRPDNSLVQFYSCAEQFRVPAVTPTSWGALCQFNSPPAIVPPANEAYTKAQIDARLITCSTGQMIYYAATGNQPTCLTVGSGLTITSGSILTTGGTMSAINVVMDYGCDPADGGATDDQSCMQNAINAAAASGGKTVYIPTGVYNVAGISIPGGVTVVGDGRDRSIIKSTMNAVIVSLVEGTGAFQYRGPTVSRIKVLGSGTGSSQHGVYVTDDQYIFNVKLDTVDIASTGGDGLFVGKVYSSMFTDIYIDLAARFPLLYDAANMPGNVFEKVYVGNLTATGLTAFRIKAGEFTCRACNGINNVLSNTVWAAVGKKAVANGGSDDANASAKFTCVDCNLEDWTGYGVLSYYGSTVTLRGSTKVQMSSTAAGTGRPIFFDLLNNGVDYYSELLMKGYIEDTVQFTQLMTGYANSQAIHSQGVPPIQTLGVGPEVATAGSPDRIATYYNTSASATGYLPRADGYAEKIAVTSSTTLTTPYGTRYVEANCAAACTVTIPWAGWYQVTDTLTIKDVGGNASTYNVTISSSGGGTVNGGSYILNRNGESVTLRPDGTGDWKPVGAYLSTAKDVRQAINLLDFGCDPADNANDDTGCIVRAITAAQAAGGKKLYVPTGTYNTDAITVNVNGLIIEGDGPYRSVIKARTSNQGVFYVTTPGYGYGLNLRDLGIKGPGKATGTTGHCVYIKDTNSYLSEFKFENLAITDCRQDGLNIPYIFSGVIERVTTDRIGEDHIDIGALGGSNTVTLLNNYVKTIEAWRVGYRVRPPGAVMMSNNGMAPDSAVSAFWGILGQKYLAANATMTSGNATLTSIASGGGFNPGDEVILANGVSSGVHLRTVVTAVNSGANTVTLQTAPTGNGATVLGTTDGASSGAVMTSGNATLANVTNTIGFETGNTVIVSNGTSSGVDLTTTISSINANANTVTLAAAPTNNGATIIAVNGTSYYRGPFLNNNIEDFGTYGIRLKENSRLGSISGNSFLSSNDAGTHIALKYDFAGAGFDGAGNGTTPAGYWDASNTLELGGGSWASSAAVHSQGVPFMVAGESPAQYYETSFPALVDLPAWAAFWDGTYGEMFVRTANLRTDNLKLRTVAYSTLSSITTSTGVMLICSDCKPNASTGTCEGSGNGSLAMGIGGTWKCN